MCAWCEDLDWTSWCVNLFSRHLWREYRFFCASARGSETPFIFIMYVVNVCREKGALVASYILAAAVCPLVYTLMMAFILYMYAMAAAPAILGCDGLKVSRACMADRRAFSPRV